MTGNQGGYVDWFFALQSEESRRSAAVVVPVLLELHPAESVLDVGGGVGAWAACFLAEQVRDVLCVDGDYVDQNQLLVPVDNFKAHDLTQPLNLGRRFDAVVCLEVAEHLPVEHQSALLDTLDRHSDFIVFSAAIPQQGGEHHVNEQWPSYWRPLFEARGFELFDIARARLWDDQRVGFWFRQNLLIYARGAAAQRLRSIHPIPSPVDIVHPETWLRRNAEANAPPPIRTSLQNLKEGLRRRMQRAK